MFFLDGHAMLATMHRVLRIAAIAFILLAGGLALLTDGGPDRQPSRETTYGYVEHPLYKDTVARMRAGDSYYKAMADAMRDRGEEAETVRAFRTPVLFVLWRFGVPMWIGYVVLSVAAGLAAVHLHSLAGPPVTLYLLLIGWSRYTQAEPYAAAVIVFGLVAYQDRRWLRAALLMLVAALVRELAVVMLVGGILAAYRKQEPMRPWVIAVGAWAGAMVIHTMMAAPHLVADGNEAPLLLSGRIDTFLQFLAYGTGHWLVGLVLWLLAATAVLRQRVFDDLLLPVMVFPIVGLAVARPNWSIMVMPVLILFAVESVHVPSARPVLTASSP